MTLKGVIRGGLNMFHMIGLCYSSTFIRNEVKVMIDNTINDGLPNDGHGEC